MKIVIAHDFLETYGGAERVTEEMARAFPDASIHAVLGRPAVVRRMGIEHRFQSVLPARERMLRHYRLGAPVLPSIVDLARLPEADVLVTSSYAFAHRFRTINGAPQVCYCHSPLRFAWSMTSSYRRQMTRGSLGSTAFNVMAAAMRHSDRSASRHPQQYITSCRNVAEQIRRYYDRPAEVIGAPIDCDRFRPAPAGTEIGDYYLFCGRLIEPYKKIGITVEAFNRLGLPLLVVGDGPAMECVRSIAGKNIEFAGALEDDALVGVMQRCRAAIFPSKDDLGLLPLEVMACGRPVLAYAAGGALDSVREGVTGSFFYEQSADAMVDAVRAFDPDAYERDTLRAHASRWCGEKFRARLVEKVEEAVQT